MSWDSKQFAKELLAGDYDGKLSQELSRLSPDQLGEVIKSVAELVHSKEVKTDGPHTAPGA